MSTATLQPGSAPVTMFSKGTNQDGIKPTFVFSKNDSGASVLHVADIAVLRSGTFRDSMGEQITLERLHIDQMVLHYGLLKDRGIFPDVPVRDGHPGFLLGGQEGNGKVVGYITGLRAENLTNKVDGKEYTYLLAEYDILDEGAQKAIQSGLWRSRSAELGPFFDNDDAMFYPVFRGVAYVDIPAVQGLAFSEGKSDNNRYIFQEENMPNEDQEESIATTETPAVPVAPSIPDAVTPAIADEDGDDDTETAVVTPTVETTAPAAVAASAPVVINSMFRINGTETNDFAAVQAHIEGLEQFRAETHAHARGSFVDELVKDGKLFAAQADSFKAFASKLDATGFDEWRKLYESAPVQPVLGQYGASVTTTAEMAAAGATAARVGTLKDIIVGHFASGIKPEVIQDMKSYKELVDLEPSFDINTLKK